MTITKQQPAKLYTHKKHPEIWLVKVEEQELMIIPFQKGYSFKLITPEKPVDIDDYIPGINMSASITTILFNNVLEHWETALEWPFFDIMHGFCGFRKRTK